MGSNPAQSLNFFQVSVLVVFNGRICIYYRYHSIATMGQISFKVNRIGCHSVVLQSRPKLVGTLELYHIPQTSPFFQQKGEKITLLSTLKVWRGENLLRVPTLLSGIVVHVTIYGSISTFLSFTDDIFLSSSHRPSL